MSDPVGPYDMLDPERDAARGSHHEGTGGSRRGREPSVVRALVRGATRRCPRCGSRDLFVHWLKVRDRCPRCRLRLEREEGGFLGAMTVNYTLTTLIWVAFLAVWLAIDLPRIRVVPLTVSSVLLVAILPLLLYPYTKTFWAAVDYLVFRSNPDYASEDAQDRASGNGGRYQAE